jgi:hypothetical protein
VNDGLLQVLGGGSPHLASQWDYDDFDVRLQWRPLKKGYNSGFYIRSGRAVGANQINLAEKDCGHLMGNVAGGPAVPALQKPPGEWNDWRVLAVGDNVTFWCNGTKAWEVTGFKGSRGYLGLQAEGAAIDFRNLRIKEIGFAPVAFDRVAGWQAHGATHMATDAGVILKSSKAYKDYTLRLEYRSGAKAALNLRGKIWVTAPEPGDAATRANPSDPWNYLEVTVRGDKGQVWLNGATPNVPPLGSDAAAPVVIEALGPATIRNVRIREAKE